MSWLPVWGFDKTDEGKETGTTQEQQSLWKNAYFFIRTVDPDPWMLGHLNPDPHFYSTDPDQDSDPALQ